MRHVVTTALIEAGVREGANRIHIHPPGYHQHLQFAFASGVSEQTIANAHDAFVELDLAGKKKFEGKIIFDGREIRHLQAVTTRGPMLTLILEPFHELIDFPTRPDIVLR